MFSFLKKKNLKVQDFPADIAVILSILSPDNKYGVLRVQPNNFSQYEADKTQIHYCTILDNKIYISSKAPYDHVVVNGWNTEQVEKLKLNEVK